MHHKPQVRLGSAAELPLNRQLMDKVVAGDAWFGFAEGIGGWDGCSTDDGRFRLKRGVDEQKGEDDGNVVTGIYLYTSVV